MIPPHTMQQITAYVHGRVPPSTFLHAVLANDLYRAVLHADERNLASLPEIVRHVEGQLPVISRGSREAVASWLKPRKSVTIKDAKHMSDEAIIYLLEGHGFLVRQPVAYHWHGDDCTYAQPP